MFKLIAVLVHAGGIAAMMVAGALVPAVLALYPPTHLGSFGPIIPAISQTHANWLPLVQPVAWAIAVVSAAIGILVWRSRKTVEVKVNAALTIGALNFSLALFFTTSLLVAYFYLPKIANAA
ncbi:hypothetical protein C9I47_3158 [Lysobacter maris]|uniref:DUF4149 domain-containing protein n=2 Tax=Marilutibacter maris TaxID=1605891 RepID=A0A2U9TB36_9GAMM|nr:hypothetical protein C9I47_3158 [Lysobacter maris]